MAEVRISEAQARKMGLVAEVEKPGPSKKAKAADRAVTRASRVRGIYRYAAWCCGPEVRTPAGRVLQEAGCGRLPDGLSWAATDRHLLSHGGGVVQNRLVEDDEDGVTETAERAASPVRGGDVGVGVHR